MDRSTINPLEILHRWQAGGRPMAPDFDRLVSWELADNLRSSSRASRSRAFGITPDNVADVVRCKTDLFFSVLGELHTFPLKSTVCLETLWNLWLPLAIQLSTEKQSLNRPLIQGILGGQGTGKTTLCEVLRVILGKLGYSTVSLSLDDLYKTYADRQQLQKADPRLIWRGPPGTHDIDLGIAVLDELRGSETRWQIDRECRKDTALPCPKQIEIPRFDKSAYGGAGDKLLRI